MAEFHATSLNLVGNYSGPCILLLTGAAVTVKSTRGVDIATWPYNCIRQFRAEDETGKFSFVSGRRGPYGVAEYVFELPNHILSELQDALSQFTGAQFNIRPPSTSSGKWSSRTDSVSSEVSTYNSPVHRMHHQSSRGSSSPHLFGSSGDVFHTISEEPHYKLPLRSTSDSDTCASSPSLSPPTQSSPDANQAWILKSQSYESAQQALAKKPKPPLKPKPTKGMAPPIPPKRSALAESGRSAPKLRQPAAEKEQDTFRRSPPFSRQRTLPNIGSRVTTESQSRQLTRQHTIEAFATLRKTARDHAYEDAEVVPNLERKSDPSMPHPNYDHLPNLASSDTTNVRQVSRSIRQRSRSFSPEPPMPKQDLTTGISASQESDPDSSNLDFLPRSSPQIRVRTISPELAQHLRKFNDEPLINKSHTVKGRRSPETKKHDQSRTPRTTTVANTMYDSSPRFHPTSTGNDLYKVPQPRLHAEQGAENLYKVPQPRLHADQGAENLYKVPQPHLHAEQGAENLYNVPQPRLHAEQGAENLYKVPQPRLHAEQAAENLYKVPQPHLHAEQGTENLYNVPRSQTDPADPQNLYNVPRRQGDQGAESLYNVPQQQHEELYKVPRRDAGIISDIYNIPRQHSSNMHDGTYNELRSEGEQDNTYYSIPSDMAPAENVYNIPRSSSDNNTYSVPRSVEEGTSRVPLPRQDNRYEEIDIQPTCKLKSSRSFESLYTRRVQPPPRSRFSPELPSPTKGNYYVDIDLGGQVASEHMYAEIHEHPMLSRLENSPRRSPPIRAGDQSAGNNFYATIPDSKPSPQLVRRPTPELSTDGMTKAQELARQGYELCMPVSEADKSKTLPLKGAMSTPPRTIPRTNFSILQKYDIQVPNGMCTTENGKAGPHSVVPSSCPTVDGENLMDEYVIITRTMQPSQPKDIPPRHIPRTESAGSSSAKRPVDNYEIMTSPESSSAKRPVDDYEIMTNPGSSSAEKQVDDYEVMISAKLNLQRATQTSQNVSDSQSPLQPAKDAHTTSISDLEHSYGNVSHFGSSDNFNRTYGNVGPDGTIDDNQTSPAEGGGISYGSIVPSSGPSQQEEGLYQTPRPVGSKSMQVPHKQLVRIASGSPHDKTPGTDLRYRSRSIGTILDVEKHTYVNVPNDELEARQRTLSQMPQNKPPVPLPRNVTQIPEEDLDYQYSRDELSKAKEIAYPVRVGPDATQ